MERNNFSTQTQKTLILLCVTTCLFIYCAIQIFKTKELKIQSAQQNDLKDEEFSIEENLKQMEEIEEKELAIPSVDVGKFNLSIFQPNESAEFPHVSNGTARIPHIIHQIGDSESIPDNFIIAMKSFVKYNPTWEYRFWTYKSGYNFLYKYHRYLVDTYDSFGENDVRKSDLLRFAVMYEYGGVYADVDVTNLRPLDLTTTKYACIIPTEQFEHASILFKQHFVLTTSVLLCRPKHPFFKKVLLHLLLADSRGHPVTTTGPVFLTDMFMQYNNLSWSNVSESIFNDNRSNAPYFYKGSRGEESDDAIYIPNSQYFGDNVDPSWIDENGNLKECLIKELLSLSIFIRRACVEFESRKEIRHQKQYTFTIHHWFHWWNKGMLFNDFIQKYDIKEIIPEAILYDEYTNNRTNV